MITNPWPSMPERPPYVLATDSRAVEEINASAKSEHRLQVEALPEPFIGSPAAPLVILGLNPGFEPSENAVHEKPTFQKIIRKNYAHENSQYPFYYLDPATEGGGRRWWLSKLKPLLRLFGPERVSRAIFCIEFFPYHSYRFRSASVPSQQYGFELLRAALAREAAVVITRGERIWREHVPQLQAHAKVFTLRNWQNVVISERNCSGFAQVVDAIKSQTADSSLRSE